MKNFKLMKIYHGLSVEVKAAFWFAFCSIFQKGISYITTPIFTRMLTTEEYGKCTIYQSWLSIVTIVITLNLFQGVYNNLLTKYPKRRNEMSSILLGLSTLTIIISSFILLLTQFLWIDYVGLSKKFVYLIFIQILVTNSYNFFAVRQRYEYKYKKLLATTIWITLGTAIFGILSIWYWDKHVEAKLYSAFIVEAVITIVLFIWIIASGKKLYDKEIWKFSFKFNLPLVPHYLSSMVLNQADRIMIANMVGNDKAAIYNIAYTIAMMLVFITDAMHASFLPYTYQALKEKRYNDIRKNTNYLIFAVVLLSGLVMAFGPELIKLIAPSQYYPAIWIVPPIAAASFFVFLYPLFGNVEFYYEKTKFVMIASCLGALLNIGLNYICIKKWGYFAAAYTTLVCYILFVVAHYMFYRFILKTKKIAAIYNMKVVIIASLAELLLMIIMLMLYSHAIIKYSCVAIVLLICLINRQLIAEKIRIIKNRS